MDTLTKPIVAALVALCASPGLVSAQDFHTVTGTPEVSDDRYSEGSAWGDINGDEYPDLFVPHLYFGATNLLFINQGDGTFRQVADSPVVTNDSRSSGGSFGDFDNDGDLDLFVSNYFGDNNDLYRNDGEGNFTRVTDGIVVNDGGFSFGASIADFDLDGWLDIYVVNGAFSSGAGAPNALYRNRGDGTFEKVTTGSIVTDTGYSSSASWCDYDSDGDPDLFVANGATSDASVIENVIYRNDGEGSFERVRTPDIGIANSHASNGSWADYDNDGDFDLMVTNFLGNDNHLYQNQGDGTFLAITEGAVVRDGGDSVSASWADYDNDGFLDLYVTNDFNENNALYHSNRDGTFSKITTGDAVTSGGRSNGATWADFNKDGFLDLFVPNGQRPRTQSNMLFRNSGLSQFSWISIRCSGTVSNMSAIGATLRVKAQLDGVPGWQLRQVSGSTGFNAQNSLDVEFGLRDATLVDSVLIEWPSGITDIYTDVEVNNFYDAVEGQGLSPASSSTSARSETMPRTVIGLSDNFPNPFSQTTTIAYDLSRPTEVTLTVYDVLGRNLNVLVTGRQAAGTYEVSLNATDLTSGVYFYHLQAGDYFDTKRMVVVR